MNSYLLACIAGVERRGRERKSQGGLRREEREPAVRIGFCLFIAVAGIGKFLIGLVTISNLLTCIK